MKEGAGKDTQSSWPALLGVCRCLRILIGIQPLTAIHARVTEKLAPSIKLMGCSWCKKQAHCNQKCQVNHWKRGGHKQECVPVTALPKEEQKDLPLTWEQLEAFGQHANRKHVLEVRVYRLLSDTEAWCYDRVQKLKRMRLPSGVGNALFESL